MPFHLQITAEDRAYLDCLPFSPRLLAGLERFIEESLKNISDEDRNRSRCGSNSPFFHKQWVAVDFFGDRRGHMVDFYINDSAASFGVLVLAFINHQATPDRF
jgi:hypothetical protein